MDEPVERGTRWLPQKLIPLALDPMIPRWQTIALHIVPIVGKELFVLNVSQRDECDDMMISPGGGERCRIIA